MDARYLFCSIGLVLGALCSCKTYVDRGPDYYGHIEDVSPKPSSIPVPETSPRDDWRPGVHYNVLFPPLLKKRDEGKVEIVELSMYTTYSTYPAAAEFHPLLKRWLKEHADRVTYRRDPSIFAAMEHARIQAKIFFALREIGRDDLQEKMDLWVQDPTRERVYHTIRNPDEAAIYKLTLDFIRQNGVDEDKFKDAYHSPEVDSGVRQMLSQSAWAKMDASPTFVVDGRFSVSAHRLAYPRKMPDASDFERLLRLIEFLSKANIE